MSEATATLTPINRGLRRDADVAAALEPWLRHNLVDSRNLRIDRIYRPEGSGVTNETILLDVSDTAGPSQLVVRVESPDYWYLEREMPIHYQLYKVFQNQNLVPTPRVFGIEENPQVLGERFFVMERRPGVSLPDVPNYNQSGWLAEASPTRRNLVWRRSVEALADFHRASAGFGVASFAFLQRSERGSGGLEQGLHYWRAFYDWATEGREHPVMEAGWSWLLANLPANGPTSLAWGDARFGNLLYRDDGVVGLLDWDLASLSGAETDLAWWLLMDLTTSRGAGLATLDGMGSQAETIALWEERIGRRAGNMNFHFAFAAFRLGAVLIKLANFLAQRGLSSPERDRLRTDNYGTQLLAGMLGLPHPAPPIVEWRHLHI